MQPIKDVFHCNHAESQSTSTPRFLQNFNTITTPFSQAQQPAHVPVSCSGSLVDAEELVRFRTPRPLVSRPSAEASPHARQPRIPSPTSIGDHLADTQVMPLAIGRDPRRKTAWLKARAQYARDRELRRCSIPTRREVSQEPDQQPQRVDCSDFGPKRKQSAFVKEEEQKCLLEDRVGTPHISELRLDDDVNAHLDIEQLGMGDVAELLAV